MRFLRLTVLMTLIAGALPAADPATLPTINIGDDGQTIGGMPGLKAGDRIRFDLPKGYQVRYGFSDKIGNGMLLASCAQTYNPAGTEAVPSDPKIRALYFNVLAPPKAAPADERKLKDLYDQYLYYSDLDKPLTWAGKKDIQDRIDADNEKIGQLQEEIKAYIGMSLPAAVTQIADRQKGIQDLRTEIKGLKKRLDGSGIHEQVTDLKKQYDDLNAKVGTDTSLRAVLRAGVVVLGENRKTVYYNLTKSGDPSAPWLLKRSQKFPVFTTDDVPYVVVLGQQNKQDPRGLRASFMSKAGSYIDTEPVRPTVTQPSVASGGAGPFARILKPQVCELGAAVEPADYTFVDRVLPFTHNLAGETVYAVTVTGYGVATTTDSLMVSQGGTPPSVQTTTTARVTLKPLDADAWPQVHSLYRYNLSTGVVWSTIRNPTFSRIATGNYLPAGCDPTTSVTNTAGTTSTTVTSPAGNTTTFNPPGTSTTTTCTATYRTLEVAGGPRILPVMMFTVYPIKRDTQTKKVQWSERLPAPSIGLSLTSPSDDFFVGANSELLRNLQFAYGLHLSRINKLGANGFQNPTDSTAPQTTTSLHTGAYVGLTFNIAFVKGLFGK